MLIVAGVLFATFMFFHPSNDARGARSPVWAPVHVAWLLSYLVLLAALPQLLRRTSAGAGILTRTTAGLVFVGTALSLPIATWDAFIVPYLALHAPDMIAQVEQSSSETPVVAFRLMFFFTVAAFSIGYALLGVKVVCGAARPRVGGLLIAIGAPLFWVGALVFSNGPAGNSVTIAGAASFGIGLVLVGTAMARHKNAGPTGAPPPGDTSGAAST